MAPSGWQAQGYSRQPGDWLEALEPWTTGLLAQESLRLWTVESQAALGIRAGGIVYPVFPDPWDPQLAPGARSVLNRVSSSWCLMGPALWVARAEPLMPSSKISHRVAYDFLWRAPDPLSLPDGPGELRPSGPEDADALFSLQEAYEKEEVLFDPREFQTLGSRLHFWKSLSSQESVALWEGGLPWAKAGTNALTSRWAQLGGVYTVPSRRGQGLQKRLLAFLLNRLAQQGRSACLFVKKSNEAAAGLYRRLGFQSGGDFTILYGDRRVKVPGLP